MEEIIKHSLGLCGEKHASLAVVLLDWVSYKNAISYIKYILKQ